MYTIAVANTKGGCGKTTIATHIAAHYAGTGHKVALADLDKQESATYWLARRPADAVEIAGVESGEDYADVPKKTEILVVDGVAAMKKGTVKDLVQEADLVVIPVLPSAFDEDGTRRFVDQLEGLKPIRKQKRDVAFIANRVRLRTKAAIRLERFIGGLGFPLIARLRDTQFYANAVAEGQSIFEIGGSRTRAYVKEWAPLFEFIEGCRVSA